MKFLSSLSLAFLALSPLAQADFSLNLKPNPMVCQGMAPSGTPFALTVQFNARTGNTVANFQFGQRSPLSFAAELIELTNLDLTWIAHRSGEAGYSHYGLDLTGAEVDTLAQHARAGRLQAEYSLRGHLDMPGAFRRMPVTCTAKFIR